MADGTAVKLAIIIVHYNSSGDLGRCLESLTACPPACEHTIVVVDNASRDPGLPEVQARFPAVNWIMGSENLGYAGGGNRGIAAVGAQYYLLLNPDIVAQPGAVDTLLASADAFPKAGIVGPQLLNEDGSIQDSCRRFYTLRTLLLRRTFLGKIFRKSDVVDRHLMRDFDHRSLCPVDWVLGGCLLVRRGALDRVGPMDERFFLYFEDVDWCYRMWQAGCDVLYTPDARFIHRHRRESARGALHRSFWLHLGSLISFYEKWGMLVYLLKKWRGPLSVLLRWAVDMLALAGAFLGAYVLRVLTTPFFTESLYPLTEYRPLLLFAALLTTVTFLLGGRYRLRRQRRLHGWLEHLKQVGTVSVLLLASTYLSHQQVFSRAVLLIFVPLFAVTTALGEDVFLALRRRMEHGYLSLERTLLVGDPSRLRAWLERSRDLRRLGIDAVGYVAADGPGSGPALPPLGGGEVPWLGPWGDVLTVVERYRISQVVFWEQPRPEQLASLAQLRRRRIRLRWRVDEAWLLAAGARSEVFGDKVSAVLEPATSSVLGAFLRRGLDLIAGCLLTILTALPYAGLRLSRRGHERRPVRSVHGSDAAGESVVLRFVCTAAGRVRPLWWQWPLAVALLRGRVSLSGPRLRVANTESPQSVPLSGFWHTGSQRVGLTGRWTLTGARRAFPPGASAGEGPSSPTQPFSFGAISVIIREIGKNLLLDPGGLGRVPPSENHLSPEQAESRTHREVP